MFPSQNQYPVISQGGFGEQVMKIQVPKNAVGVVIGKGGEMINQIQGQTMTRVQFKPEDQHAMERECTISGNKDGVDQAVRRIQDLINQVQERDGNSGGNYGGMCGVCVPLLQIITIIIIHIHIWQLRM